MTVKAWLMDSNVEVDQREPHYLEPVPLEVISELGVLHWEGLTGEDDQRLAQIRADRGYSYTDTIHVSPDKLPGIIRK